MEEDINKLERYLNGDKIYDTELDNALRNLIARYKELEKHYQHEQEYINGEVFSAKQMHYIEDNYIDKSKIQEKIEEIHNEPMNYSPDEYWIENECKGYCIDKMKELLED